MLFRKHGPQAWTASMDRKHGPPDPGIATLASARSIHSFHLAVTGAASGQCSLSVTIMVSDDHVLRATRQLSYLDKLSAPLPPALLRLNWICPYLPSILSKFLHDGGIFCRVANSSRRARTFAYAGRRTPGIYAEGNHPNH